ncbi:hypothetical protein GIB67_042190 [Kingdonia uniflora]|uniref:Peptidase C19 ubiquitin carboxyl-terminal hydrolase domain-containing protein n=1 Tax=Kingdonia uniflora TaxID=39325 RepID=A0A7J7NR14_9MAGN|nr:hypothetical protein GIB67_042190 [Kingdonia uniflora]
MATDSNKVLVFGSFTEDEVISLKKKSPKNIIEPLEKKGLQFGSLDFASVKSLGSPDIELKHSKLSDLSKSVPPPKFVNEDNGFSCLKTTEDNGYTHSPPHVFPLNNCLRGPKKTSVDLASLCISETNTGALKQSPSPKPDTLDDATLEHQSNLVISVPNEVHVDLSEPLASKEHNQNALNGPRAAATDLLPRGLINSGNLCFLNSSLQAFLSCSPFVQLLQDLRARTIPKIGYPTLSAFLQFISELDMPTGSSLIKNQRVVLETGEPFLPFHV